MLGRDSEEGKEHEAVKREELNEEMKGKGEGLNDGK